MREARKYLVREVQMARGYLPAPRRAGPRTEVICPLCALTSGRLERTAVLERYIRCRHCQKLSVVFTPDGRLPLLPATAATLINPQGAAEDRVREALLGDGSDIGEILSIDHLTPVMTVSFVVPTVQLDAEGNIKTPVTGKRAGGGECSPPPGKSESVPFNGALWELSGLSQDAVLQAATANNRLTERDTLQALVEKAYGVFDLLHLIRFKELKPQVYCGSSLSCRAARRRLTRKGAIMNPTSRFFPTPWGAVETSLAAVVAGAASVDCVFLDLWKTLARGPFPEPINEYEEILGLSGKISNADFLQACLTTNATDPAAYLQKIARKFAVDHLEPDTVHRFESLVQTEIEELERGNFLPAYPAAAAPGLTQSAPGRNVPGLFEDVAPTLKLLRSWGKRLVLVTNSTPFPARKLLAAYGLTDLFDDIIISAEIGIAKQAGAPFFERVTELLGVRKERTCMVDDNHELGIVPAVEFGMPAILIDRYGAYVDAEGRWLNKPVSQQLAGLANVHAIRTLGELPQLVR